MIIGHPPAPSPVEYEHSSPSSPTADNDSSPSSSCQTLSLMSSEAFSSIDWDAARRRFTLLDLDDDASSDAATNSHHRRGQSLPFDNSHGVPSKPDHASHGVFSSKTDYGSHGVSSSNSSKPDHTIHVSSSNKAASGKGKVSINGKSPFQAFPNGTTIAMNVYSYPASVPAQTSFTGPIRPAAKPSRSGAGPHKKTRTFVISEPTSPHVTCLGRVKIRDPSKRSHGKDSSTPASNSKEKKVASLEKAGNFLSRRMKAFSKDPIADHHHQQQQHHVDSVHIHLKPFSCTPAASASASSHGLEQTRRERAASLAQSLTELLEDNGRHSKTDQASEYSPSVPPPNSLLMMRTSRRYDDFPDFKVAMSDENGHNHQTEGLSSATDESRTNGVSHFVIKVNTDRSNNSGDQKEKIKSSTGPLSELEGNAMMAEYQLLSAQEKTCHPAKLWERRSIGELSAIEVAKPSPARRRS